MNDREKFIELICESINDECSVHCNLSSPTKCFQCTCIADHLIANGVKVQKSHCPYCCDDRVGHGRLKYSYDDEDGMAMSIHPSPKRENGYQSQAWWATVHFRGESRDFYIEVCPFCGRRLVPFKEEYETSN